MRLTLFKTIQFTKQRYVIDNSQHAYTCAYKCTQYYFCTCMPMYVCMCVPIHVQMYVRMTCMLQMCRSLTQETLALSKVQTCL